MVKSKVIRLDPLGIKRVMDVGGPAALNTTIKKPRKVNRNKAEKNKPLEKPTILTIKPKHALRSPVSVESDSASSEYSDSEMASIWPENKTPPTKENLKQSEPSRPKSASPVICPSGNHSLTVAADVHCSQGGTKAVRQGAQKPALSARASSEPPNPDEIAEDNDFTVITPKKRKNKAKVNPPITEAAINTALPSSPAPESRVAGSSEKRTNFLTAPREKIPPVVIHHHFQGDMTRLNKDFHSKFQPIGFTTYRMKAGIACQTSTYQDYLNLQSFLKESKVPFNLIKHNDSKPYRVVIKGIPPTTPPKAIQDELLALGLAVQNVIPMSTWRDKTPLPMHIIELDNVPQSQKISQLSHLCYIRITVEPYKGRAVPPQCARCQQFYHVAANCQAPPACAHCAEEHCSWQCEKRFEPNFVPTCALCKIGDHGSKYRGCPYFRNLMEKEMRNKPQPEKLNNRQPSNVGRARNSFQSMHPQNPPSKTLHDYPPMSPGNAWSRPLNFSTSQLPQPPPPTPRLNQPRNLLSNHIFVPHMEIPQFYYRQDPRLSHKLSCTCNSHPNPTVNNNVQPAAKEPVTSETGISPPEQNIPASPPPPGAGDEPNSDSSVAPNSRHSAPKLSRTKGQTHTQQQDTTHPREEHSYISSDQNLLQSADNMHQHGHQPPRQRLGNSYTEHQTREFVNCVRAFNPNFSFQCLLQTMSVMLLQFMQHPYESALPVIFNNFLINLLGLPHNG